MQLDFRTVHLHKRFPLEISRGVITGSDNLFVGVTRDGITGVGESSPDESEGADTQEAVQSALERFVGTGIENLAVHEVCASATGAGVPACALAALDMALWDWMAKKAGMPLYQLLGLGKPRVVTSLTTGINPPAVVRYGAGKLASLLV